MLAGGGVGPACPEPPAPAQHGPNGSSTDVYRPTGMQTSNMVQGVALFIAAVAIATAAALLAMDGKKRGAVVAALILTAVSAWAWAALVIVDLSRSNVGGPDCGVIPQRGEYVSVVLALASSVIPLALLAAQSRVAQLRFAAALATGVEASVIAASFAYIVTANASC